jgi:hypothetical protein
MFYLPLLTKVYVNFDHLHAHAIVPVLPAVVYTMVDD